MDDLRKKQILVLLVAALIILLSIIYVAFALTRGGTEDKTYLTPIPQGTIDAFRNTSELKTKLQAVIAAQRVLPASRIRFEQPPRVRSVAKTTLSDAYQQVAQSGETYTYTLPDSTPVWLVWFEGNLRIEGGPRPPNATEVPSQFGPGCAYVIILTSNQQAGTAVGGLSCPK